MHHRIRSRHRALQLSGAPGTWTLQANALFDQGSVNNIAIDPNNEQVTYAATPSGLYVTQNGGQTWNLVPGPPASGVSDVVLARYNPKILFVSVLGNIGASANLNGVWTNAGGSWFLIPNLPNSLLTQQFNSSSGPGSVSRGIQIDTGKGGTVYLSLLILGPDPNNPGGWIISEVHRFRSIDNGGNWNVLGASGGNFENRPWHQLIAVDPANDLHVFYRPRPERSLGSRRSPQPSRIPDLRPAHSSSARHRYFPKANMRRCIKACFATIHRRKSGNRSWGICRSPLFIQ